MLSLTRSKCKIVVKYNLQDFRFILVAHSLKERGQFCARVGALGGGEERLRVQLLETMATT